MPMNPIPVLHHSCGHSLSDLMACLRIPHIKRDTVRSLTHSSNISQHLHQRLFMPTMVAWGNEVNANQPHSKELWDCYFPDTLPHIYQVMAFIFYMPVERLCRETGLSKSTILKILRQPKVTKRQLRAIYPFASMYRDALYSERAGTGRDQRYVKVHRALTDVSRIYQKGEIKGS